MSSRGFSTYLSLFFTSLICCYEAMPAEPFQAPVNDRPVIGVLTQVVSDEIMKPFGRTYIPDSYVNYIESGGSRVMPISEGMAARVYLSFYQWLVKMDFNPFCNPAEIDDATKHGWISEKIRHRSTLGVACTMRNNVTPSWLTLSDAEYESIFKKINGLFFIGGAADLKTSDFARVAKIFYKLALTANDAGDFFPIWGTCMGMQLLTVLVAEENLLSKTTAENVALPLNLTTEADSSRMFQGFPKELIKALTEEPLTGNFHRFGVTVKAFQDNEKLSSFFSLLSTNMAENGAHFVSTIEGKTYPFYGVQWHPEVNRFQWDRRLNFPHSSHAVQLSSLLAEFFINEGRKSLHHFDSPEEEDSSLIYKFTPVYTANFTAYEQIYFF